MKKFIFCIMLFVSFTIVLFGEIIYVPGDYPTIQEAIDHALTLTGSVTIEVEGGDTYYETLNINLTSSGLLNLTLIGVDGAENCIIDGGNGQSVVEVENNYQPEKFFKISGFTIRNSITANGIYAHTNNYLSLLLNIEISDNIIQNCREGIKLFRVNECLVKDNTVINYSDVYFSCGIHSQYVNNVVIDGNVVSKFLANISLFSSDGKVINNELELTNEHEDIGIALSNDCNVSIISNLILIFSDPVGEEDTGIENLSSNATIVNNTIVGFGVNSRGYRNTGTTEKFVNNIMWDLETNIYAGSTVFEVNYCCYNGDIPEQCEPIENHNVIDINPELTPDYHLSEDSILLIDGGDPDTDGDGDDWEIDEDDRDIDGSRKDMGCYPYLHDYDTKHFSPGWQWPSFPVLDQLEGEMYEQAYYENDDQGLLQETYQGDPTINGFRKIEGKREFLMNIQYIDYEFQDNLFGNMLFRQEGYKIFVEGTNTTTLIVDGDRLPVNHTIDGVMNSGEYHWLGFWLPRTQNMIESFGGIWQYVEKVKSEDWFYSPAIAERGGDPTYPVAISAEGLTLEYGKAYLVLFNAQVEGFHWTDTSITIETEKKSEPENFTYTEKADYEAIDVFNIPPSVTEIGVFEDGVCVGAVVVEDTCAQILVYSDNANRDPVPFTFEVVTGRGSSTPIKDFQVMDLRTGKYESRSIISGRQEYSVIRFGDEDEPENEILSTPQLHGNYPNPFNPTTTISFSVTQNSDFVTLEIFNIKGQKVKTLYKGIAEEGKHSVTWEGKDTNGKTVGTGIYFYKLKTSKKEISRKMLLLK